MAAQRIVIVGAGLGGLSAALRLSHLGHQVLVLEKTDQVGGRNRSISVNASVFDAGPTLLMMLAPFRKLFADVGEKLEDHLELQLCDPSYRVFYSDGSRLEGTPDPLRMADLVEAFGGIRDLEGYKRLLKDLRALYEAAMPSFVERNFYSPLDFLGPKQLWLVTRHRMLANLARRAATYVKDPRLQMLFTFQTMYLGLSPYHAPWVYSVLTYMEYGEGIYYPRGGITQISKAVAGLACDRGAEIRLDEEVVAIEGKTVVTTSGERIAADTVVCNADLPYAERDLLRKAAKPRRHSCSAYMMYIDYEGELPELLHHNVFFGSDFRGNLEAIFRERGLPSDPAFYAAISARSDHEKAMKSHENLYVLVPCANLDRPWTDEDGAALQQRVFERLAAEVGFDKSKIAGIKAYTPLDWLRDLNLDKGAAFGLSHDFFQSAFFRPSNRGRDNPDLYFVGASTLPGNGMPMVLISADLLVQRMQRENRI